MVTLTGLSLPVRIIPSTECQGVRYPVQSVQLVKSTCYRKTEAIEVRNSELSFQANQMSVHALAFHEASYFHDLDLAAEKFRGYIHNVLRQRH